MFNPCSLSSFYGLVVGQIKSLGKWIFLLGDFPIVILILEVSSPFVYDNPETPLPL